MLFGARLYDYKARVYDPAYGHFLQTDPIGSKDDLDLYAYTADDPVNHGDPTGLETGNFSNGNMSAGVTGDLPDQWQKHHLRLSLAASRSGATRFRSGGCGWWPNWYLFNRLKSRNWPNSGRNCQCHKGSI
ncbi:MAG: RHS repeat-associated core domain-containing protein [Asticcacaulis sp.]